MKIYSDICPKGLAKEILSKAASLPHPYIIYTEDEIPSLRERVKSGVSAKAYSRMVETANSYLPKSGVLNPSLHPAIGRFFQSRFAYLCLTGVISGDDKYLDKAKTMAADAVASGSLEMYVKFNNALSVGDFGHAYALAYDLLYDRFSDEERAALKSTMEQLGEWIYENSPKTNTWGSPEPRRQAWNWNVITHGALGMIALALGEHEDWLALSIERLLRYCRYAVDSTGAAMEGLHYIGFALNTLTPLDLAIHRITGVELMDGFPAMQSLPYWSMNMTAPMGREQAAIGQGGFIGNYSTTYYIINRYKQADALWGWLHTNGVSGDGEFYTEYEGNGWSIPAIILFEDQTLVPKKPDEGYPMIHSFAKGIVTARDSWERDGSMATFTCGYGYAGCWNHPDDTSFTFYAKGESFIIDLGANRKTSQEHNVISVDGIGMDYIAGAPMVIGVTEQNSILEGGELYLRGNNTNSYVKLAGLEKSTRQLIYCGGKAPFVIAYDIAVKEGKHTYATNFYTRAGNAVEISEGGEYARLVGERSGGVCYVIPYSPNGVTITAATAADGITTESQGKTHRQATVFIATDGELPEVGFSSDEKTVTVTVDCNGEKKSYVFSDEGLISPAAVSTKEASPVPEDVLASIGQEANQK